MYRELIPFSKPTERKTGILREECEIPSIVVDSTLEYIFPLPEICTLLNGTLSSKSSSLFSFAMILRLCFVPTDCIAKSTLGD